MVRTAALSAYEYNAICLDANRESAECRLCEKYLQRHCETNLFLGVAPQY